MRTLSPGALLSIRSGSSLCEESSRRPKLSSFFRKAVTRREGSRASRWLRRVSDAEGAEEEGMGRVANQNARTTQCG